MLAYSGRSQFVLCPLDLNDVVQAALDGLSATVASGIRILTNLDDGLPLIRADRAQLGQMLQHLLVNAAEAIGSNAGTIEVATGIRDCTPADLEPFALAGAPALEPGPQERDPGREEVSR